MENVLPHHRRRQILHHLEGSGSVRVSSLAKGIGVAEETIRRDLRLLEREGVLIRTHGGAITANNAEFLGDLPIHQDVSFGVRLSAMAPQKRAIAAASAELVQPGQVIALDGSTTAWELARILPRQALTVVTNSLVILNLLAKRGDVRIVCTGGRLNTALQMFEGIMTDEALRRLHIDLAFFSCRGIDAKRGLSDPSDASARYKQHLIDGAANSVLLADHTKFDARSVVYFANVKKLRHIITDSGLPAERLKPFSKLGIDCRRASSD